MSRSIVVFIALVGLLSVPHGAAAQAAAASRAAARPAAANTVVNINTASAADLEALPGVGAKLASRIIDYRQKNGPFKKVEELMNVQGIGEKNFLKLKNQITIGATKAQQPSSQQ